MERHTRTAALLEALGRMGQAEGEAFLESLTFGLSVSAEAASTVAGQVATLTAANLLARIGGSVAVNVAPSAVRLDHPRWSGLALDAAAEDVVSWSGGRVASPGVQQDSSIVIGGQRDEYAVTISGNDWTAEVDGSNELSGSHPLGIAASACMGSARAFHLAMARRLGTQPPARDQVSYSLLTHSTARPPMALRWPPALADRLPEMVLVGAGAVANAFVWSVATCAVPVGTITIVDPQRLDESNLNRHLAAGLPDVGRAKASILKDFLLGRTEAVTDIVDVFSAVAAEQSPMPLLLSTVDNDAARYQIQSTFPKLILHAATSQEHLAVGVLDALDGACLGCLFPRPRQSPADVIAEETGIPIDLVVQGLDNDGRFTAEMVAPTASKLGIAVSELEGIVGRDFRQVYATEICGRLGSRGPSGQVAPTVSYVSSLAGIILAAEFAKLSNPETRQYLLRNYLQMTPLKPDAAWVAFRDKEPNCPLMCGSDSLQDYLLRRQNA